MNYLAVNFNRPMKNILFLLICVFISTKIVAQFSGQNAELKQLSKDFISSAVVDGSTNNESVDFAIIRDTLVIHCAKWVSGDAEKNEFVYLLPIKSIGEIESKTIEGEGAAVNMISVTANSGLPDFIFKFGSVATVREEMAGGVSEDDLTVFVTVTLPNIKDVTKYERLKLILTSLK